MALSIDFAFEGVRIVRERPIAVLFWGALYLAMGIAVQLFVMPAMLPLLDQMTGVQQSGDPTQVFGVFAELAPIYGAMLLASLVISAIFSCAVYRAVLGRPYNGVGYFSLGMDEVRQFLLSILVVLFVIGVYLALAVAGGIVLTILSAIGLAPVGIFLMIGIILAGIIFIMVKLSLCGILSFDKKKLNLFNSFKTTRGHFWPLLAGYLVAVFLCIFIGALFLVIFAGVASAAGYDGVAFLARLFIPPENTSVADIYSNPLMMPYELSSAFFLSPLVSAILTAAPAAAYKLINGETSETVEVF